MPPSEHSTGKVRIAPGPCCPNCGLDTFDDWHLTPGLTGIGGTISGRLRCHGCGRFFRIDRYPDGVTHSTSGFRARSSGLTHTGH